MMLSKEGVKKINKHRPSHLYDGHTYFLTGRCYRGKSFFKKDVKKNILKKKISELSCEMEIGILAWVILDNHYHIIFTLNLFSESGMTDASLSAHKPKRDTLASVTPDDLLITDNLASVTPQSSGREKLVPF